MKIIQSVLSILLFVSCANGSEKIYTGSTPADPVIRSFLGIPLPDSIDFIRWKLIFNNNSYQLQCNYGIGKPNTNGFINGGKKIEFTGELIKDKNYYRLKKGEAILNVAELNRDLLHLLNEDKSLLAGNSGWSYTLSSMKPVITDEITITGKKTVLKDSMAFEGRTPCAVPGIIPAGMLCYKLKWYIVLYGDTKKNEATTYKVFGTPYRKAGGKTGTWKITMGRNNRIIYQLNDDDGKGFIYLLKADEHILLFTDAGDKLLVGNEDFSFTLNRVL
jgi:hypothetical protein